jgi:hypothetical protein
VEGGCGADAGQKGAERGLTRRTMDSMDVLRSSTRGDQRIKTCQTRAGHARHAPEGRGVEGKEKDKESLDGPRGSRELHAGQLRVVDWL